MRFRFRIAIFEDDRVDDNANRGFLVENRDFIQKAAGL
jgi:hypothetical protein